MGLETIERVFTLTKSINQLKDGYKTLLLIIAEERSTALVPGFLPGREKFLNSTTDDKPRCGQVIKRSRLSTVDQQRQKINYLKLIYDDGRVPKKHR